MTWKWPLYIVSFISITGCVFTGAYAGFIVMNYDYLDQSDYLFWHVLVWTMMEHICMTTFYIGVTSFFASKVDDRIGATYMSMMWTITNMSGLIMDTLAVFLVGKFDSVDLVPEWDPYHYVLAIIMIISIIWYIAFTIPVFRTRSLIWIILIVWLILYESYNMYRMTHTVWLKNRYKRLHNTDKSEWEISLSRGKNAKSIKEMN